MHPWVQIVKDPKELAAAQVEVVGEAEQEEEIQQETGQKEAAKVQQEQETVQDETGLKTEQEEAAKVQLEQDATSDNIQEETGETRKDYKD